MLLAGVTLAACGGVSPARRGRTVIYASGADLQSINPLVTVHPLAKQVQPADDDSPQRRVPSGGKQRRLKAIDGLELGDDPDRTKREKRRLPSDR